VNPRAVVVAHQEPMAAEAIASALGRFPPVHPIGVASTAPEAVALGRRADAVAIDSRLPGAPEASARLRRMGVRVVALGDGAVNEDEARVPMGASVASLAAALAPGAGSGNGKSPHRLTSRELEVLTLVSRGFTGKQIARLLGISSKTVENHKTNIFSKLDVPNQAAAVGVALTEAYI
jgi:DNA-binding NarL/FixJ family response regulator